MSRVPHAFDSQANDPVRLRRNMQRIKLGALTSTIGVDGTTIEYNPTTNQLEDTLVVNEVPFGLVNGVNTDFVFENRPQTGSLMVSVNGLQQQQDVDFTLATQRITFLTGAIPQTGDLIIATYRK